MVTNEDVKKTLSEVYRDCLTLLEKKGADYSENQDRLSNFRESGRRSGVIPIVTLGIFLDKHLCAIFTFIRTGKVESEHIRGRILDAINYLILLLVMIEKGETGREL